MPLYLLLLTMVSIGIISGFLFYLFSSGITRYREHFTESTKMSMTEVFLFIDAGVLWQATFALAIAMGGVAYLLVDSWVLAFLITLGFFTLPSVLLRWVRQRRLRQYDQQLPDALLAIAGGLRAGVSIQVALLRILEESPAPLVQEFGILIREQRLGQTWDDGLQKLGQRVPTEVNQLVVAALRVASETGGNLAETLERIAALIRAKIQLEGRIVALTAQGKLQAWMVGALPLLLLLVLYQLEPQLMEQLWTTSLGVGCLLTVIALEVLGMWWIRKIVAIDI